MVTVYTYDLSEQKIFIDIHSSEDFSYIEFSLLGKLVKFAHCFLW